MDGTNGLKETTLSVNVFTAPGKAMVGERPRPFGEALGFDPITSTLIFGEYDAVLVGAMTTVAEALADWIALHNRNLEAIYITHAHFDHFYGLSILLDRFPGARAIATPKTVNARQMSFSPTVERLARHLFPGQVPTKLVPPEPYEHDTFTLGRVALGWKGAGNRDAELSRDTLVQLFFSLGSDLIAIVRRLHSAGLESRFRKGERAMSERAMVSVAQAQREQKIKTRTAGKRFTGFTFIAVAVFAVLVAAAVYAQDKYSLKSPGGIAFSDFKGYEDWAVVSSARTDEVLKVIVANPAMINAFKTGAPGNGLFFPEGSMIVKLQWKPKRSTEAPFAVDVPDVFKQAFVMEKDSKRFPKTGGWGYAVFNYDAALDKFTPDEKSLADCGHSCHVVVKAKDYIFHPYQKR